MVGNQGSESYPSPNIYITIITQNDNMREQEQCSNIRTESECNKWMPFLELACTKKA
jgi:hypothetical protein